MESTKHEMYEGIARIQRHSEETQANLEKSWKDSQRDEKREDIKKITRNFKLLEKSMRTQIEEVKISTRKTIGSELENMILVV